jgi:hypothetical protein
MMPNDAMADDNRGNNSEMGASRIFFDIHWEEEEAINKRTAKLVESALMVRVAMFATGAEGSISQFSRQRKSR